MGMQKAICPPEMNEGGQQARPARDQAPEIIGKAGQGSLAGDGTVYVPEEGTGGGRGSTGVERGEVVVVQERETLALSAGSFYQ